MRKLFVIWVCFGLASCSSRENVVMDETKAIPENGWLIENPLRFEMDVEDTMQLYDVYITLRHSTDYEWMNLFLFLKTYYPNQEFSRDTLECFLSDETGRWFGEGGSSVKDCRMLFKRSVRFPREGRYIFEFTQGMRVENLKNIVDVGVQMVAIKE